MRFRFQFLSFITFGDFDDIFDAYDWFKAFAKKGHINLKEEYERAGNKYYNFNLVDLGEDFGKIVRNEVYWPEIFKEIKGIQKRDNPVQPETEQPSCEGVVAS